MGIQPEKLSICFVVHLLQEWKPRHVICVTKLYAGFVGILRCCLDMLQK